MLDNETKRRIDTARDILVGKVPDPKSQVEQITIALIYKFMDDMDAEAEELGGKRKFFSGDYERYGWKKLMAPGLGGFEVLTLYTDAIQKMNINPNIPKLFRDIFKNAYLPYRDPETLKSFLKIIDDFEYDHSERLGDAFEYLLSILGSQGDAGQFRTPRHIIDFMVEIISPKKNETILDPACGTAGFLISSYKHIIKQNSSNYTPEDEKESSDQTVSSVAELVSSSIAKYSGDKLTPDERKKLAQNIKGYDISPDMVRLSLVNLYLHGFNDPKIYEYDTLTSEDNWNEYADVILANPPFMSPKGGIKPHKRFSIQSNRSEVLFVDYIIEHLTPHGRAAIIVPEGIIFQSGKAYKHLRKTLVENYLFAVVSLPAGVFNPYSGVKTSILLVDKSLNKKTEKILFAKIENDGFDLGAQRRRNNKSELPQTLKAINEYVQNIHSGNENSTDQNKNILVASKSIIAVNGEWNLSGERYRKSVLSNSIFEIHELENVTNLITCGVAKRPAYVETGIPFLSSKNVKNAKIIWSDYNCITEEMHRELTKNNKPEKGDILYTRVGSYGEAAVIDEGKEFSIFVSLTLIKPKHELINPYYLRDILNSKHIKKLASENITGIGVGNLNVGAVRKFKIPLPPLEVQKEIVAEIEGYQKIIDGARQVVENYKPQIQIDPSWEMVELGEVTKVISGFAFESNAFSKENTLKCIKITNVGVGEFVFDDENNLPSAFMNKYSDYKISMGDIVIALTRSIISAGLKVAIVPSDYHSALLNQRVAAIRPIKNVSNSLFVFFYLRSPAAYDFILNKSRSLMQPNLSIKDLKSLLIPLPSIEIQDKIVNELEKELHFIDSNKELISIFEKKIKDKIASVWGE